MSHVSFAELVHTLGIRCHSWADFILLYQTFRQKVIVSNSVTRILSLQADTMSDPKLLQLLKVKNIGISFTEHHLEALCTTCDATFTHATFIEDFCTHIRLHHCDIVEIEEHQKSKPSWKYIRSNRAKSGFNCVLCKESIDVESLELCSTLHTHVDDEHTLKGINYEKWELKYCDMRERQLCLKVQCYICQEDFMNDDFKKFSIKHLSKVNEKL